MAVPIAKTRSTPGLLSWAFSLISLTLVTVSGLVGLVLSLDRSSRLINQRLSASLAAEDFRRARELVGHLSESRPLEGWFTQAAQLQEQKVKSTIALELIALLEQSKAPKFAAYSATIDRAARGISSLPSSSVQILTRWDEIQPLLRQNKESAQQIEKSALELDSINHENDNAKEAFTQIASRFAKLLGLDNTGWTTNASPTVFKAGVLKDLPALSQLPDNLTDLSALRELLQHLGGGVSTSGSDPQAEFQAEITSLRALTGKIMEDQSKRDERGRGLNTNRQSAFAEIEQRRAKLSSTVNELVVELSEKDPQSAKAAALLQEVLNGQDAEEPAI